MCSRKCAEAKGPRDVAPRLHRSSSYHEPRHQKYDNLKVCIAPTSNANQTLEISLFPNSFVNLLGFEAVRSALEGVEGVYFVSPILPGILQATAYFAQAAKEPMGYASTSSMKGGLHRVDVHFACADKVVITGEGSDEIFGGYAHFGRNVLLYGREEQDPKLLDQSTYPSFENQFRKNSAPEVFFLRRH